MKGGRQLAPTDPAALWHAEYEYRRAFGGLTHEQYLDEPGDAIAWLTRIHGIVARNDADRRRAEAGG